MVAGRPVPAVQGVWRSRGYGYVARITADGAKLFHIAGDFCYADPRPERETNSLFSFYRPWGTDGIAFSRTPEQTRFVFDRLPSLPAACNDPAPWSRPRIAALVAATFADLYPSFAERGIDWPAQAAAALRALNGNANDATLFDTLRTMLAGIEDPHVELHAKVAGKARDFEPGDGVTLGRIRGAAETAAIRERGNSNGSASTGAACSTPCCRAKDIGPPTTNCCGGAWATSAISTS